MSAVNLNYKGRKLAFDPEKDMTLGRLRQIKAWFPDLGSYVRFLNGFAALDPEALLCAIWVALSATGDANVPTPNELEDCVISGLVEEDTAEVTAPPTKVEDGLTPSSTGTPTSSDDSTSDS